MSLPSRAIFHLKDGTDKQAFCNIGWFWEERYIPRTVGEAMQDVKLEQEDWHSVTLYEHTYTKKQLNDIMQYYWVKSYEEWKKEHLPDFTENERKILESFFDTPPKALDDIIEKICQVDYKIYCDNRYKEISKSIPLYP